MFHLVPSIVTPVTLRIAELSASILSKLAISHQEQTLIAGCGALPPLLSLLEQDRYPRIQEAALDALAALCFGNFQVVTQVVGMKGGLQSVVGGARWF